jgi:hypothetical protein
MKITEKRLRSIIRNVIKESMYDQHHVGHVGPDPGQALGRPTPKSFEMEMYYAVQENSLEKINKLRVEARAQGYTNFEKELSDLKDEIGY